MQNESKLVKTMIKWIFDFKQKIKFRINNYKICGGMEESDGGRSGG